MSEISNILSTLKRANVASKTRKFTFKDLKKSVDASFPSRKSKTKDFDESYTIMSKKNATALAESCHLKHSIQWDSPAVRGDLFLRFMYLSPTAVPGYIYEKVQEAQKEVNKIAKSIGIDFGKKVSNEFYIGLFCKIFKAAIQNIEGLTPEELQKSIQSIVEEDYTVKITEENFERLKNLFSIVLEYALLLYESSVSFDELGYHEVDAKIPIQYIDINYTGNQIEKEKGDIQYDFDVFEIANEYITIEEQEGDGVPKVVRGTGKSKKSQFEVSQPEIIVSTKKGELATQEEVDRLKETSEFVELDNKVSRENKARQELIEEVIPSKKVSRFKEFYAIFESELTQNVYWQTNMFSILEDLSNPSKSNDDLAIPLGNALNENYEAVFYLLEHRDEIIEEFTQTKLSIEKRKSQKNKKAGFNKIKNKRNKREQDEIGTEEDALTNHQILAMLGMDENTIRMEQKLGLKSKNLDKDPLSMFNEEIDEEEQEIMDYINIMVHDVPKQMGTGFTKIDLPEYCCFDSKPAMRKPVPGGDNLYPVSNFPAYIQGVFSGVSKLNLLQSTVRECAFESDESMLVCAPTGAGKTNVALLTVMREIDKAYDEKTQTLGDFKIVYISPLKALATEVVEKFGAKLSYLGVSVKEYTGDIGLTKQELQETNIIVSTPEKWDVMTRKSDAITELVKLIIIDEIHLLDEERGRVLECIVARTLMNVERRQKRIRLVGLSATLPNYIDVARFMQVKKGLFFFSEEYRPVPLFKKFIGVRKPQGKGAKRGDTQGYFKPDERNGKKRLFDQRDVMNEVCYDIVRDNMIAGEQVLVFVHSRAETVKTAKKLLEIADERNERQLFAPDPNAKSVKESGLTNKDLRGLVNFGLGSHNAGLSRNDRRAIETGFLCGALRVVCCTATLAWGVNLPAHCVIIKGTDIYEPGVGWKDLSILDVQQIFGRAGRPQFDEYGEAVLITKIERLNHFIAMMSCKAPINSHFNSVLMEALNAEISLGNICSLSEAFEYLKRTFWYVRMRKNPIEIGVREKHDIDGALIEHINARLLELHKLRMVRYDPETSILESTELGRIASHYYINCSTMEKFCTYLNFYEDMPGEDNLKSNINIQLDIDDQNLLAVLAQASEFSNLQVRPEELDSLNRVKAETFLHEVDVDFKRLLDKKNKEDDDRLQKFSGEKDASNLVDSYEKVMLLIQGYLSMISYDPYSLVADTHYVVQNGTRILRCIFEICLRKNLAFLSMTVLKWCRYIENCIRDDLSPLRMFCFDNVKRGILNVRKGHDIRKNGMFLDELTVIKVEKWLEKCSDAVYNNYRGIPRLREEANLGSLLRLSKGEEFKLQRNLNFYPILKVDYTIRPVAQTILKIDVTVIPDFEYSNQFHLGRENFWVIVENRGEILHYEEFGILSKDLRSNKKASPIELSFFLPFKGSSSEYMMYIMSDRFPEADSEIELDLKEIVVHSEEMEYTDLLNLRPLNVSVLGDQRFSDLYQHIRYFNPLQTQVFHALFHTDHNSIIGAPTGSGKTIMAEIAMLRVFKNNPKGKIVYVGPYKALVKERLNDWVKRLEKGSLKKKVLELTGDYTPDLEALIASDVLVTTPEKWDGISRNWQHRSYVTHVSLVIFDEIHLLGQDRGPVIEVIVSRMNYISMKIGKKIRMLGLSTAMANGADVANWFGVPENYMFNFRPNVRPVPVEIHFKGFSERNYCPRMNSMNKPAFMDITKFSFSSPVLIFVSSRRQTRLTALDLISLAANEYSEKSPYLRMSDSELGNILLEVQDSYLKQTLAFGIGMHHAGLITSDRKIVEKLFVEDKIQILVATSTLAWGVNFPAKLVIIKGTEFFDPKLKTYVDMPISDILQMVGRAGRPQFNDKGFACVYVEKSKKNFYRKYLNDPFPIESCLKTQLAEHFNAEIASGTITTKQQCMDYLSWTYFVRRLVRNPLYYNVEKSDNVSIKKYLMDLIDQNVKELVDSGCVECENDFLLSSTHNGYLASFYYITHKTLRHFDKKIKEGLSIYDLLKILSEAEEYDEVPVRHNEEHMNDALANICPYPVDRSRIDSPKIKTLLLFQAYFSHLPLPIRDYITDTKLVLDNCVRFVQSMIDMAAEKDYLDTMMRLMQLCQMITQAVWIDQSCFSNFPHFTEKIINGLRDKKGISHLCQLIEAEKGGVLKKILKEIDPSLDERSLLDISDAVQKVPDVEFNVKLFKFDSDQMKPDFTKVGATLRREDEIYVNVNIKRNNSKCPMRVETKGLSKIKDCSWWIVIGCSESNSVYYVKKTFFKTILKRNFQVTIPDTSKSSLFAMLVSDSYIGIDQIINFDLDTYKTPKGPKERHHSKAYE